MTPRRESAMKPVTPPPPPKKVTPPKGSSPRVSKRDMENFKRFEAEEQRTLLEQDLDVSSDTDEKDDDGCIGRNSIFPSGDLDPGEDPKVNAQSDPKQTNPRLEKEVEDSDQKGTVRKKVPPTRIQMTLDLQRKARTLQTRKSMTQITLDLMERTRTKKNQRPKKFR